jgi:HAD superfamily hydrolase (TIGR01549 family)
MNHCIKAIFFDIGGTLRYSREDEERDPEKIRELISMLDMDCSVDDFIIKVQKGEKTYRKWCKPSYIELSEPELWTRFMLPGYRVDFVRDHAIQLNQLWRDSRRKYLLPDMVKTLKALSERGYKLGLISNTTSSIEGHQLLAENDLTELFSTVILSAAYGRRKPHPSVFLAAAREAGVQPSECAYVGDRPSRDVVGARETGFAEVVIIQLDGKQAEKYQTRQKPDHIIRSLQELLELFPVINPSEPVTRPAPHLPLYDCSISTMWGIHRHAHFNEFFIEGRRLGFARFELNHQVTPVMLDEIDFNTYHINSLHEPCPAVTPMAEMDLNDWRISSLDEDKRAIAVNSAKQTIDMAVQLGCRYVVLHPGATGIDRSMETQIRRFFNAGKQDSPESVALRGKLIAAREAVIEAHLAATITSLQVIGPYAFQAGIAIALENRYHYDDIPLLDEMQTLLDLFDESGWGFNYDVGHAQALDRLGFIKHQDWLTRCGSRMIATHLHDVAGITDHQVPGTGDIDFQWVASHLPATVHRTLEVAPNHRAEDISQGMEHLVLTGCVNKL